MLGQDTVVFLLYDWPYSLWPITREHQEEKRLRLFKPRFDAKECKWWIINKLLKLLCFFWGEISISGSGHIRLGKTQERGAAGAKWVLGHICLTFWGPLVPYPYFMCVQLGLWIVFPLKSNFKVWVPKIQPSTWSRNTFLPQCAWKISSSSSIRNYPTFLGSVCCSAKHSSKAIFVTVPVDSNKLFLTNKEHPDD